jgi:holo-[acyl-carrier protein] synthase
VIDPPAFNFEAAGARICVGFDLVKIRGVMDSVAQFGERFRQRLFTPAELAYADAGLELWPERLAARFAAKEATIKALNLANAGVSWREIEVQKLPSGACELLLHGGVAAMAKGMRVQQLCLSLSHDGDYAGAFVLAHLGAAQ